MKRTLSLIAALILALLLPLSALADDAAPLLNDEAFVLGPFEYEEVYERLWEVNDGTVTVAIVTTNTLNGLDSESYCDRYYDSHSFNHSAVLLLYKNGMEGDREVYIRTFGDMYHAFSSQKIDEMLDDLVYTLSDGDYEQAFLDYIDDCSEVIEYYKETGEPYEDAPMSMVKRVLIALGIGLVIGLVIVLILKSGMKSVRYKGCASDYVVPGSLNVRNGYELYLYANVTRVKIESNSSSGGSGGGSRGGGGRSF